MNPFYLVVSFAFLLMGCATQRVAPARFILEAQTDYPWKMQFCTDIDPFRIQETSGSAKMWILLEHPNLGKKMERICLFIEKPSKEVGDYYERFRGVQLRYEGWRSFSPWRSGYYGWPGRLSDQLVTTMEEREIIVEFGQIDFPAVEDCWKFLEGYAKDCPQDVVLGKSGMWVHVYCGKSRSKTDRLYIEVGRLTINGKALRNDLIWKYKTGTIKEWSL